MSAAFFPGSFDPFTVGHCDIVERALALFDRIIIGVGVNSSKTSHTDAEQRAAAIRRSIDTSRVTVIVYDGLTAHAARQAGATVLLRGLRNAADLAYEQPIAEANRREFGIETAFILARPEHAHISSSLVRELTRYGHDTSHLLA